MKFIGKYFWVELSERAEGLRSNFDTVLGGKEDMDHVIHGNIEQALAGIVTFPDYPVMIGDTWRAIRGKNDEGKTSSDKADFKLMRIHGSSATLKTIFKGWGDFSDGSATGTFTGTNIIDIPSGMTTEGKYETSMKATTKIDNEDVPIDSKSILTFNITKQ
jgi:hypothetical protein